MRDTDQLLDSLASGLEPVPAQGGIGLPVVLWFLCSAVYVVVVTQLFGPIRPTALEQLQSVPRFTTEIALGVVALATLAVATFRSAIPGRLTTVFARVAWAAGIVWAGGYIVALVAPALEPSMLGKRGHCYLETIVYATPPLLVAVWWQRKHFSLAPARSAALAGLVAGGLPALYMQIACMYQPVHGLAFHLGPALLVAAGASQLPRLWNRLANPG